jgi:hypothetical protein
MQHHTPFFLVRQDNDKCVKMPMNPDVPIMIGLNGKPFAITINALAVCNGMPILELKDVSHIYRVVDDHGWPTKRKNKKQSDERE